MNKKKLRVVPSEAEGVKIENENERIFKKIEKLQLKL